MHKIKSVTSIYYYIITICQDCSDVLYFRPQILSSKAIKVIENFVQPPVHWTRLFCEHFFVQKVIVHIFSSLLPRKVWRHEYSWLRIVQTFVSAWSFGVIFILFLGGKMALFGFKPTVSQNAFSWGTFCGTFRVSTKKMKGSYLWSSVTHVDK